jgi:hypothetical protein
MIKNKNKKSELLIQIISFVLIILTCLIAINWFFKGNNLPLEELQKSNLNLDIIQMNVNFACSVDSYYNEINLIKVNNAEMVITNNEICINSEEIISNCRFFFCDTNFSSSIYLNKNMILKFEKNETGYYFE